MLSILWQICDMIGLIFIDANGQILKNLLGLPGVARDDLNEVLKIVLRLKI